MGGKCRLAGWATRGLAARAPPIQPPTTMRRVPRSPTAWPRRPLPRALPCTLRRSCCASCASCMQVRGAGGGWLVGWDPWGPRSSWGVPRPAPWRPLSLRAVPPFFTFPACPPALPAARVLHADLKPDNLLVTLDAQQGGAGGWVGGRVGVAKGFGGRLGQWVEVVSWRQLGCGRWGCR